MNEIEQMKQEIQSLTWENMQLREEQKRFFHNEYQRVVSRVKQLEEENERRGILISTIDQKYGTPDIDFYLRFCGWKSGAGE